MRKQSGFTLIELMVVMAIIAILATAGLAAYGGYLKKAKDATRIEDIRALETVAVSTFTASGKSVSLDDFKAAVLAMNNNVILKDPLDNTDVCLNTAWTLSNATCWYYYAQCNNGGYILRVKFESLSNHPLYTQDKLNSDSLANLNSSYDVGNCDSIIGGQEWFVR